MNETVGAKLKRAREQRHLSLQQVSDNTKVRSHYLQALENDDLSAMPSAAQARGFLRIYAEYLGLALSDLVQTAPTAEAPVSVPPASGASPAPHEEAAAESTTPNRNMLTDLRERLFRLRNRVPVHAPETTATSAESASAAAVPAARPVDRPAPAKKKAAK